MTKSEIEKLFYGLIIYADLTEKQIKFIEIEQRERLAGKWEIYEEIFTENVPTHLRYSVIVTLVTNIEWALNYSINLLVKKGSGHPTKKRPKGISENAHKIQFLNQKNSPAFSHPFEEKFLAITALRNAIVHNAGRPKRHVTTVGPFGIYLFDDKIEQAAKILHPSVSLNYPNFWIEEGVVVSWIKEAYQWLSALYDFLQIEVTVELPISTSADDSPIS